MDDPMTAKQGDEIIWLLKKIAERLKEIEENTSHLPKIAGGLEQVQNDVFKIWLKT